MRLFYKNKILRIPIKLTIASEDGLVSIRRVTGSAADAIAAKGMCSVRTGLSGADYCAPRTQHDRTAYDQDSEATANV